MSDSITITGIQAFGHHGVLAHERRDGQTFVVDVTLALPLRDLGDDLERTVNYADVAADVVDLITGEPADLIETLAEHIAEACLARALVQRVRVVVHKPQAPIPVPFADVTVTIERSRESS